MGKKRNSYFMLKSNRELFRHCVNKNGQDGWQGHNFSSNETCSECFNRKVNKGAQNDVSALLLNEQNMVKMNLTEAKIRFSK